MIKAISKEEFEEKNNVRLLEKNESKFMKFLNFFFLAVGNHTFMTDFWTTYRLPFQKPTITYVDELNMKAHESILEHEMVHVEGMRPWYGPIKFLLLSTIFPLPIIFSGRWFIERYAYLGSIKRGSNIDDVVNVLWNSYGWCWPKKLMKEWFLKNL